MRKLLFLSAAMLAALPVVAADRSAGWVNYSQSILSATILLVIVIVGGMALRWNYRHSYRGKLPFWHYTIRNTLVQLTAVVIFLVVLVNVVVPNPYSKNDHDMAAFAKYRQMPHQAEESYRRLSERYPFILDYHFEYISAHYQREGWASKDGEVDIASDQVNPVMAYSRLGFERNPYLKDIARLGIGMCDYYEYSFDIAMYQFRGIQTKYMPYRNLFMGRVYLARQQLDSAEYHFRREIALGVVPEPATAALAQMLYVYEADSTDKMIRLMQDPVLGPQVPLFLKRYAYTKRAELFPYLGAVVADWWDNLQWIGLLGALLGTVVWMLFLRRIDTMRRESWLPIITVFAMGAAFSFLGLILYDFVRWDLGFDMSDDGAVGHDFLYCVLGIGVIEELVKIIPFLLLMQFTKRVNSPVSYLLYASFSALGFAFIENIMYFDAGHIGIIHGRVLICNVFHMFATSTIAFGMMLGRYRYGNLQWPFFFLFFILAALMHGFYDFWLVNETVGLLVFMTYGLFIYATFQYAAYLNNALNQSEAFRGRNLLDPQKLAVFLTVGLVGILLFEYCGLSLIYGAAIGNYSLIHSLGMGSFLMFFVVLNLSNIDMVQGEWIWIRFWNFGSRIAYNRVIGQRMRLLPKLKDSILATLLPASGEVIARVSLNGDSRYFLFQFDKAPILNGFPMEYVLLRAKKEGEIPEPSSDVEAVVMAFRDKEALLRRNKRKGDFKILDTVQIE
jgi:RsiW-degrading membrane proteinase PrsW (M82 family)